MAINVKTLAIIGVVIIATVLALIVLPEGGPEPCVGPQCPSPTPQSSAHLTWVVLEPVTVSADSNPNRRYGYLDRWILNLVYDPFAKYVTDETAEAGSGCQTIGYEFEPIIANPGKANMVNPDPPTRVAHVTSIPGIRFSDGTDFRVSNHFANSLGNISEVFRELGLEYVVELSVNSENVVAKYTSWNAYRAPLWELILSIPRVEGGGRIGTGPYRFANKNERGLSLVANEFSSSFRRGAMPREINIVYYESLDPLFREKALYDVLVAGYNPWASRQKAMPSNLKMKYICYGAHFFLFVNRDRISDPNVRQKFFTSVFRPARDALARLGGVETVGMIPTNFWFPDYWLAFEALDSHVKGELRLNGFQVIRDDPNVRLPADRDYRIHLVGPFNQNHAYVQNVQAYLKQAGVKAVFSEQKTLSEESWDAYDFVIFANDFDLVVGDPTQLLNLAPVRRVVNDTVRTAMRVASELIFVHGRDSLPLAEKFLAVQRNLLVDKTVFPLFASPVFIFYNTDRLRTARANYREGFVRMDQWGFSGAQ